MPKDLPSPPKGADRSVSEDRPRKGQIGVLAKIAPEGGGSLDCCLRQLYNLPIRHRQSKDPRQDRLCRLLPPGTAEPM
jgi:hypothetical protein